MRSGLQVNTQPLAAFGTKCTRPLRSEVHGQIKPCRCQASVTALSTGLGRTVFLEHSVFNFTRCPGPLRPSRNECQASTSPAANSRGEGSKVQIMQAVQQPSTREQENGPVEGGLKGHPGLSAPSGVEICLPV